MRKLRALKIGLALAALLIIFLAAFYFFWLSPRYVVPILMYHYFDYNTESSISVTPENFERQMAYLKNKNYNVISLEELVEGIKNNKMFKHNTVVITVDDGYKDNYVNAYPVLKKYGFPATIFIIANFIGRREGFMDWRQVREMSAAGISFGSHTKNNAYLPSVEKEKVLWDELAGSKKLIERKLRVAVDYFCYPTGGFTEKAKEVLKKAGYKGACTTNRGFAELNKDIYELKRVKVTNSDMSRPFNFWIKLSGYYNLFRSKKNGLGI
ncbi:polysaccharide deacetylase family protein [Candidatus Omnitrophota bacterium]